MWKIGPQFVFNPPASHREAFCINTTQGKPWRWMGLAGTAPPLLGGPPLKEMFGITKGPRARGPGLAF